MRWNEKVNLFIDNEFKATNARQAAKELITIMLCNEELEMIPGPEFQRVLEERFPGIMGHYERLLMLR